MLCYRVPVGVALPLWSAAIQPEAVVIRNAVPQIASFERVSPYGVRFWTTRTLTVDLEYDDEQLTFNGFDTRGWSGTSEYEYWVSVDVASLRAALGIDDATDLGDLLCARADEIIGRGESSWLAALGLEPSVRTWSSLDSGQV